LRFRVQGRVVRAAARGRIFDDLGRRRLVVEAASARDRPAVHDVAATPGRDVVVLAIADGPTLVLHPEHARDLLLAQRDPGARRSAAARVVVGATLHWASLPRGAQAGVDPGSATLERFEVVTLTEAAAAVTALELARRLDERSGNGVFPLATAAPLRPLKGSVPLDATRIDNAQPLLLFVHGTFVETAATFGKLWSDHPDLVQRLFAHYGGRVLAFDHPTLRTGPVANAIALAQALPRGARLHLVTHSRGGLVADVLARAADPKGARSGLVGAAGLDDVPRLLRVVRERSIRVERVVRVACPAHGTLLASRRLDACLSVLRWTLDLAGIAVAPTLVAFLAAVARQRFDPARLPGLAAMVPRSALVRWLNDGKAIDGELRVLAGDVEGDSLASWVATLVADAYFRADNDFVVQTRSMYGGARRRAPAASGRWRR
jgi:hypothetical protein